VRDVGPIDTILRHLPATSGEMYVEFQFKPGRLALPDIACDLIWTGQDLRVIGPMRRGLVAGGDATSMALLTLDTRQAAALLGMPLGELTDLQPSIRDVAPALAAPLEDLFALGGAAALVGRPVPRPTADPVLARAAAMLAAGAPPARASGNSDWTSRHFRRRFREVFGMSPGEFRRVARFRRAVRAARAGGSLAEAALVGGYADQPHFNRECQELMGLPPRAVLAGLDGVDAAEGLAVGNRGEDAGTD
jgi:AraC-like DNA-binding protein